MGLALNAPLPPELLQRPLATPPSGPAVQVYQWEGRFGPMRVEVIGEAIYVNGQRVEPAPPR